MYCPGWVTNGKISSVTRDRRDAGIEFSLYFRIGKTVLPRLYALVTAMKGP